MEPIDHVESVAVGLWIGAGAAEEEARYAGISHFTEHMLFKGTSRRSSTSINDRLERLGGELSHIVVMQHVTEDRLGLFLNDLSNRDRPDT